MRTKGNRSFTAHLQRRTDAQVRWVLHDRQFVQDRDRSYRDAHNEQRYNPTDITKRAGHP